MPLMLPSMDATEKLASIKARKSEAKISSERSRSCCRRMDAQDCGSGLSRQARLVALLEYWVAETLELEGEIRPRDSLWTVDPETGRMDVLLAKQMQRFHPQLQRLRERLAIHEPHRREPATIRTVGGVCDYGVCSCS